MASDSPTAPRLAAAEEIGAALSVLERALDALEPGASPDLIVTALAEPVRAFSAVVREGVR